MSCLCDEWIRNQITVRALLTLKSILPVCLLTLVGLAVLLSPDPAGAAEIAILKSADLAAYNQAVAGFKASFPPATSFAEYDMQGDRARGSKLAQKIRATEPSLLLAVGSKAAQVAKQEIAETPVIF